MAIETENAATDKNNEMQKEEIETKKIPALAGIFTTHYLRSELDI